MARSSRAMTMARRPIRWIALPGQAHGCPVEQRRLRDWPAVLSGHAPAGTAHPWHGAGRRPIRWVAPVEPGNDNGLQAGPLDCPVEPGNDNGESALTRIQPLRAPARK